MQPVPAQPKIYHITHLNNLSGIVTTGGLWSDAERIARGLQCQIVGMSKIKQRRLAELEVSCHPGTTVGQYVPFYFCPRSVMLYLLYKGNHIDLDYRGGQTPILHLQADLHATVRWAESKSIRWAFTTLNAGARYNNFYASLDRLNEVNWSAVVATDWKNPVFRDGKQAEFLLCDWFPWHLVEKIGVINQTTANEVTGILFGATHIPTLSVEPNWYY